MLHAATENMDLIVWKGCAVGEPNEQFAVEGEHLKVQDPAKAATPCLQAMPCVSPCVLPSGWGVRPHPPHNPPLSIASYLLTYSSRSCRG